VHWTAAKGTSDDAVLTLTADIPAGTTAEVLLPGEPALVVGPGHHIFLASTGADTAHPELMRSTL
jgi:alpha-L-rhamnosidase